MNKYPFLMPLSRRQEAAQSTALNIGGPLAGWILTFGPEFGTPYQFTQSGKFEKALPESSYGDENQMRGDQLLDAFAEAIREYYST